MKSFFQKYFLKNYFKLLSSFNMHAEIDLKTSMKGEMQIY